MWVEKMPTNFRIILAAFLTLLLDGIQYGGFHSGGEVQFGQNMPYMLLDGIVADAQGLGDGLVAFGARQQLENFTLALGQ